MFWSQWNQCFGVWKTFETSENQMSIKPSMVSKVVYSATCIKMNIGLLINFCTAKIYSCLTSKDPACSWVCHSVHVIFDILPSSMIGIMWSTHKTTFSDQWCWSLSWFLNKWPVHEDRAECLLGVLDIVSDSKTNWNPLVFIPINSCGILYSRFLQWWFGCFSLLSSYDFSLFPRM